MVDIGKITPTERNILQLMVECDMNASWVARRMGLHYNTVYYHIGMIEKATGKNPRILTDLLELHKAVSETTDKKYSRGKEAKRGVAV